MRKPADITEEQYKEFYHELYPTGEEPLFSIHLNIDYPFHLTGILYFPKIRNNFEIQKNKIQLYSNQVYVTDQVEGIVPEYLTLLHGVIDSPDIPLNVSRSYLQSDSNVKKISNYITRKVADRLQELFNTMRPEFEKKWDDLKIFIQYGILTDEKFAEKAQSFMLWKNTDGKYFTPAEYEELVKANQTDKHQTLVFLTSTTPVAKLRGPRSREGKRLRRARNERPARQPLRQLVRVEAQGAALRARRQRHRGQIDPEGGLAQKCRSPEAQQEILRPVFEAQMPHDEKIHYNIAFEPMAAGEAPVVITQNEFTRRMKEMAAMSGGGMSQFYGQMPDNFTLVVNGNHPDRDRHPPKRREGGTATNSNRSPRRSMPPCRRRSGSRRRSTRKKEEELTAEEKNQREELSKKVVTLRDERNERLRQIGEKDSLVRQIIDLALLTNGCSKAKT